MAVEVVDGVVLVFIAMRWRLRCWRIVDNCLKSFVFFMMLLNLLEAPLEVRQCVRVSKSYTTNT